MTFEELSRLYRLTITEPHVAKGHYLLQYSLLVDNSPLGPDCPYAARAQNKHYNEQVDDVIDHLRNLRSTIDILVEEIEDTTTPPAPVVESRQLDLPFMVQ